MGIVMHKHADTWGAQVSTSPGSEGRPAQFQLDFLKKWTRKAKHANIFIQHTPHNSDKAFSLVLFV